MKKVNNLTQCRCILYFLPYGLDAKYQTIWSHQKKVSSSKRSEQIQPLSFLDSR